MSVFNQFTVLNRGGAVLWSTDRKKTPGASAGADPINTLVQDYILGEKSAENKMDYDNTFRLEWIFAGEFNLVFVAVYYYQLMTNFPVQKVLRDAKNEFVTLFKHTLTDGVVRLTPYPYEAFGKRFDKIVKHYMQQMYSKKKQDQAKKAPRQFKDTQKGKDYQRFTKGEEPGADGEDEDGDEANKGSDTGASDPGEPLTKAEKLKKLQAMGKGKGKKARGRQPRPFRPKKKAPGAEPKDRKKTKREWFTVKDKVSKKDMQELNFAGADGGERNEDSQVEEADFGAHRDWSDDEDEPYVPPEDVTPEAAESSGFWGMLNRVTTNRPLTAGDLDKPMQELEQQLIDKNVASPIADEICKSVTKNLVGQRIGSFTTIRSAIWKAMHSALGRILTPKYPVNVRAGIERAKQQYRPYSIVMVGVNGVGKSTSLSKVVYYLKQHGLKVSIAACDTFRSGAVEQLKTHSKALGVRLFEKGYAKDAAQVAGEAIESARVEKDDVVMIDTAGRMQANKAHMRALSNLIQRNAPDLVLFVGEALVGNDGVDQLMKFNEALTTHSIGRRPRAIDGIILTKFDTVDDKVGASISMTYKCGKPIVFVGTGQQYPDLKRMDVNTMVGMLLK